MRPASWPTRSVSLLALSVLSACGPSVNEDLLYAPARTYSVDQSDTTVTYDSGDIITPSRTINVRVRSPRGVSGALPLVVVIHGGGFNTNGHRSLSDWGEQLAQAGYVAINFGNAEDEGLSHCTPLGIPESECTADLLETEVSEGGTMPASLYSRPQDVEAILDDLAAIEEVAGISIDQQRIGALGHSAGAHATLSLAGMNVDISPSIRGVTWGADSRIKAFVANSPQGVGRLGIHEDSWDGISSPVLIQTGSGDTTSGETAASRRDPFEYLAGSDVFEHYIDDTGSKHNQFGLSQDDGVTGRELTLATTAIAFFDAYLRDREEAVDWLASDNLSDATGGVSTLSRK